MVFNHNQEIVKAAFASGKPDDWLDKAEELIEEWASCSEDEVQFHTTSDITIASLLLVDDLLPPPARKAFARLTLETIRETTHKKVAVECLRIKPPSPGRKDNEAQRLHIKIRVMNLVRSGLSKTEAYEIVAAELCKAPDTIRRAWERPLRVPKTSDTGGEIDQ